MPRSSIPGLAPRWIPTAETPASGPRLPQAVLGAPRGLAAALLLVPLLLASCSRDVPPEPTPAPEEEATAEPEEPEREPGSVASPRERPGSGDPSRWLPLDLIAQPVAPPEEWVDPEDPAGDWAEGLLQTMSLRQKAAQLMMPIVLGDFAPEGSASHRRITRMVEEQEVGGVIVSIGTPTEVATKLNVLQRKAPIPLLVAADLETGAGFRLRGAVQTPGGQDLGGATDFPPLMALGAAGQGALAYEMGRVTAVEARAVGIHVPFAPVLDVNNNPDNPIINTRAFGEDPETVARLGTCFVRGVQDHGALATGKHFPGHGDTGTDSHLALPVIDVGRDRMDAVELRPFQAAVDAGMGAIMTAHIALPEMAEDPRLPATLSRRVLTELLREEMGFHGLVFTDAMDMNAIDRLYGRGEAAVRAVEAGADVILMPPDVEAAVRGIMDAVLSGRLPEERLDRSVRRILRAKQEMGLHRERTVDLEEVHRKVGVAAHTDVADEVAERSLTLLRNRSGLLPLVGTPSADVLSVTYRRPNDLLAGRYFDGRLSSTYRNLSRRTVHRSDGEEVYDRLLRDARDSDLVVVSTYVQARAYAGDVAVAEEFADFVNALAGEGIPHVVVSFGNPYLLEEFPDARAYLLAWGGAAASQRAAARALLGDSPVGGMTPTAIPPDYRIGDGLALGDARPPVAVSSNPGSGDCCLVVDPDREPVPGGC